MAERLRVCVICGVSFLGFHLAKTCSLDCRASLKRGIDERYAKSPEGRKRESERKAALYRAKVIEARAPRFCRECGASIDHRHGRAMICEKTACKSAGARRWQIANPEWRERFEAKRREPEARAREYEKRRKPEVKDRANALRRARYWNDEDYRKETLEYGREKAHKRKLRAQQAETRRGMMILFETHDPGE